MAWKTGKLLRGKRPYKRWSQNKRSVSQARFHDPDKGLLGGTVNYRHHVISQGSVKADADFRSNITTPLLHLPKTLSKKIDIYKSLSPDLVPPMIQSLSKGYNAITADGRFADRWHCMTLQNGELLKIHMMFSGQKAYFIEEDNVFNTIRRSITYKREKARRVVQREAVEEIVWIEKLTLPALD